MQMVKKNQKGFTLVELLAVIVILGIIAMIAVPAIGNIIDGTREDSRDASILMIRDAAQTYLIENDAPTDFDVADLQSNGFLRTIPKDPTNNDALINGAIVVDTNGNVSKIDRYFISASGGISTTAPTTP